MKSAVPGCQGSPWERDPCSHCWLHAAASGFGSMGKLQTPHQRWHPLWFSPIFFFFFLLSSLFWESKEEEDPEGKHLPVCVSGSTVKWKAGV